MVPAGHVIKFIAEVAVAIVEVEMKQEVRKGEKKDDEHAIREKRWPLIIGSGRRVSDEFHFCICSYARMLKTFRSFDFFTTTQTRLGSQYQKPAGSVGGFRYAPRWRDPRAT